MPEVMRDAMAASQAHVAAKMPAVFARMQARVRAELAELQQERKAQQEQPAPAKGAPWRPRPPPVSSAGGAASGRGPPGAG